jgi:hypothetical protein
VLKACPNREWRLLFSLGRFGGLRIPSELTELRWSDVNWEAGKMTIRSPKTAHHVGHESRIVPMFPELRSILGECFDAAPDGAEFIFDGRIRDGNANLRTQLERIVERAGLKPWPKIWQNLRATRATELAAEHPGHVAAEWLGHSKLVAQKHYWRVTDADFTKALADNQNPPNKPLAESNALVAKTALQIQARQPIAIEGKPVPRARKVQGMKGVTSENPGETRGFVDNQGSPDRGRTGTGINSPKDFKS